MDKGGKRGDTSRRFEDALTLSDDDIDDNWENYKERFLAGGMP